MKKSMSINANNVVRDGGNERMTDRGYLLYPNIRVATLNHCLEGQLISPCSRLSLF
jgi:hypothetical protein